MFSQDGSIQVIEQISENVNTIRKLIEQIKNPLGIIPFVGAGMSMPFDFPGWKEFLSSQARVAGITRKVNKHIKGGKYEEAAEDLQEALGLRAFNDAIEDAFGDHKLKDNELRGAISLLPQLARGPIITTNFDHIVEAVFERTGCPFERVVWGGKVDMITKAFHQNKRFLLKMHGDVEDRTERILTLREYQQHYGSSDPSKIDISKLLPLLLQQMLESRPLLFIGCSLEQDRILAILEHISNKYPAVAHYAIVGMPKSKKEFQQRAKYLSDHCIRPIWYPKGRHDLIEPILAFLVEQIPQHLRGCQSASRKNRSLSGPDDPSLCPRSGFFGRTIEVEQIIQFLISDAPIATVTVSYEIYNVKGAPGIGKTEVCKAALKNFLIMHPKQRVYYVELSEARDEAGFLARLAEAFGVIQAVNRDQILDALKGMPGIIYLDNLEDVITDEGAIDLLKCLITISGVRVLASSRETLPGIACNIPINRLDIDAAVKLFCQEWRRSGTITTLEDSQELREFLERDLSCHPLSIVLVAAQAYQYNSLTALRDGWREESMRLARLPRSKEGSLTSLEVSLSRSFKAVLRESPEAKYLWGLMEFFPEGLSTLAWRVLFEKDFEKAVKMRETLMRLNIIEVDSKGMLQMLAPLRQFILQKMKKREDDLDNNALAEMAYSYFYYVAKEAYEHRKDDLHISTLDTLLLEFSNLYHFILSTAFFGDDWPSKLSKLSFHLLNYYQFRILLGQEMLQYILKMQRSAGFTHAIAQSSEYLGDLESRLGKVDEAQAHYQEAITLYRQERSNLGLANVYQSMGDLERSCQKLDQAKTFYINARNLYIAERDKMGLAYTCSKLAQGEHALGNSNECAKFISEAVVAAKSSNVPDVMGYVLAVLREINPESSKEEVHKK